MVSPVTEENSTSVSFYVPNDTFYDFFTGEKTSGAGIVVTRDNVNYTDIPVHIRGGSIIPLRISGANNTRLLRELDFELLVAPSNAGSASGRLYLDDGESLQPETMSEITFQYNEGTLTASGSFGYETSVRVQNATLLGAEGNAGKRAGKAVLVDKPLTEGFVVSLQ